MQAPSLGPKSSEHDMKMMWMFPLDMSHASTNVVPTAVIASPQYSHEKLHLTVQGDNPTKVDQGSPRILQDRGTNLDAFGTPVFSSVAVADDGEV
jgi:hypothetical protein